MADYDYDPDEWEIVNDDGFVYKCKKSAINPLHCAPPSDPIESKQKRSKSKRAALLKLKQKYQTELSLWDDLSNTLKKMEDIARQQVKPNDGNVPETGHIGSESVKKISGSLVPDLLLQVEAQEDIIRSCEQLCDVAESLCNVLEEKANDSYINLPIWSSPRELMASLCED